MAKNAERVWDHNFVGKTASVARLCIEDVRKVKTLETILHGDTNTLKNYSKENTDLSANNLRLITTRAAFISGLLKRLKNPS